MMRKIFWIHLSFVAVSVFNCAPGPQIEINQSRKLALDMSEREVVDILKKEPGRTFNIFDGKDSITVLRYLADMQYDKSQMSINDVLYVLLKNDATIYWGLMNKFKLSQDEYKKSISDSLIKYDREFYQQNHNDSTRTPKYTPPVNF